MPGPGSYRTLARQEEHTLHEELQKEPGHEPPEPARPPWAACRLRWLALATLGLTFLALALALHGMPGAMSCTELLPSKRPQAVPAAWAGRLKGPVERRLKADSVGDAIAILQNATKVAQEIQEEVLRLRTALAREAEPRVSKKRQRRRAKARCVLETLALSEQVAKIATNLKASVAVCAEDPLFQMLQGRFGRLVRGLKKWICVINIELVIIGFFSIASGLANAAVSCSVASNSSSSLNMAQQVDASCTQAGVILVQCLVTLVASLQLTIPGCQILALGFEKQLKAGLSSLGTSAATFGQHGLGEMSASERAEMIKRLESQLTPDNFGSGASIANLVDPAGASAAAMGPAGGPARRLFLGGGPEVFMTNCVVDVLQALTALGLIGTTLDTIINADCRDPFVGPVTSQALPKFLRDRVENSLRAGCASGISNILAKLGIAVLYLSFTSFHCTNKANLRAICGAGIAGIEASFAGLAAAGAGAYLACTEGQRKKQTEVLIENSLKAFVQEKSQEVLDEYCPDLSVECFLEFSSFLGNCPNGVNSTCPETPSESSCPGVASCVTEFEVYRAANMGTPWFPTPTLHPVQFGKLVIAVPACWEYLDCFSPGRRLGAASGSSRNGSSEKLQSHARRSFLLQKVFASDAWSATTSARSRRSASPGGAGMELVEQLFASTGRNLTARAPRVERSQSLLDANLLGENLLHQASQHWQQHKSEVGDDAMCFDAPLLDESDATIP